MPLQRDIHRHRHLWANVNYISCRSWPEGGSVQRCVDMAGLNSSGWRERERDREREEGRATVTVGCLFAASIGHIARQHVSRRCQPHTWPDCRVTATATARQWLRYSTVTTGCAATVSCKGIQHSRRSLCTLNMTARHLARPNDDRLLGIWHNSYVKNTHERGQTYTWCTHTHTHRHKYVL